MNKDGAFVTEAEVYLDIDGEEEYKTQNEVLDVDRERKGSCGSWSNLGSSSAVLDLHKGTSSESHALLQKSQQNNKSPLFGVLHLGSSEKEISSSSAGCSVAVVGLESGSALPGNLLTQTNKKKNLNKKMSNPHNQHNDKSSSDEEIDVDTPYHGTLTGQTVSSETCNPSVVTLAKQFKHLQHGATSKQSKRKPITHQTAKKSTTQRLISKRIAVVSESRVCETKLEKSKVKSKQQNVLKIKMIRRRTFRRSPGDGSSFKSSLDNMFSTASAKPTELSKNNDPGEREETKMISNSFPNEENNSVLDIGSPSDEKFDDVSFNSQKISDQVQESVAHSRTGRKEKLNQLYPAQSKKQTGKSSSLSFENSLGSKKRTTITTKIALRKPLASKETSSLVNPAMPSNSLALPLQAEKQKNLPLPEETQHLKHLDKSPPSSKSNASSAVKRKSSDGSGKLLSDQTEVFTSHNVAGQKDTKKQGAWQPDKMLAKKTHYQHGASKLSNNIDTEDQDSQEVYIKLPVSSSSAYSSTFSEMELWVSLVSLETAARPFDCSTCMQAFHMALACPKAFRQLSRDKPFKCLQCPARFVFEDHLKRHQDDQACSDNKPACFTDILPVSEASDKSVPLTLPRTNIISKIMDSPMSLDFSPQVRVIRLAEENKESSLSKMTCKECGKIFKQAGGLGRHMLTHNLQKKQAPIVCTLCDRKFLHNSSLKRHMYISHGRKFEPNMLKVRSEPLQCDLFSSELSSKTGLIGHKNQNHSGYQRAGAYKCGMCFLRFLELKSKLRHIRFCHTECIQSEKGNMFKCRVCNIVFMHWNGMWQHTCSRQNIARQKDNSAVDESASPKSGNHLLQEEQDNQTKEINKSKPVEGKHFKCDHCHKSYSYHHFLQRHVIMCHMKKLPSKTKLLPGYSTNSSKTFKCTLCLKEYFHYSSLKKHTHTFHKRLKQNQIQLQDGEAASQDLHCSKCNRDFLHQSSLAKHMKQFHFRSPHKDRTKQEFFRCKLCKKQYGQRSTLYKHTRICHPNNSVFNCKMCGAGFQYAKDWLTHNQSCLVQREEDSPYKCHRCDKNFTMAREWTKHMQTHYDDSGDDNSDDKSLHHSTSMEEGRGVQSNASATSEPQDNTVECSFCLKLFKASYVAVHIKRFHNQSFRYKCDKCSKGFFIAREWMAHMESHKNEMERGSINSERKEMSAELPSVSKITKDGDVSDTSSGTSQVRCKVCKLLFNPKFIAKHERLCLAHCYKCELCGECFHRVPELNKHIESHTNIVKVEPSETTEGFSKDNNTADSNSIEGHNQGGKVDTCAEDMPPPLPTCRLLEDQGKTLPVDPSDCSTLQYQQSPTGLHTAQKTETLGTPSTSRGQHFTRDIHEIPELVTQIISSDMQSKETSSFSKSSDPFGEMSSKWITGADPLVSSTEGQETCDLHILGKPNIAADFIVGKISNSSEGTVSSNDRHFLQEIQDLASLPLSDDPQISGDLQFLSLPVSGEFEESENIHLSGNAEVLGVSDIVEDSVSLEDMHTMDSPISGDLPSALDLESSLDI